MLSNPSNYLNILDIWQKHNLIIDYYHVDGDVTNIYNLMLTENILPLSYSQIMYLDGIWYGISKNENYRKIAWLNKPEDMSLPLNKFIKLIDFKINFLHTSKGTLENTFTKFIITSNMSLECLYPQLLIYKKYNHILNWISQYHVTESQ